MRAGYRAKWQAPKVFAAVVAAVVVTPSMTPTARADGGFTGIDGGQYAAAWRAAVDGAQPYPDISADLAVPITMDDGTVLKADIIHPARGNQVAQEKTPVILQMQGYGKVAMNLAQVLLHIPGIESVLLPWLASLNFPGSGLDGITDITRQLDSGAIQAAIQDFDLAKAGYTLVQVDLRGTGTSQGQWQVFGERERQDTAEVIDWINRQPWASGKVGTMGTSFTAITALQAADRNPPGLDAVFAYEGSADIINDIVGVGGGVGIGFLAFWLVAVNLAKMAPDVESVIAGKFDPAQQLQWLRDRLADPATMLDVVANAYTAQSVGQLTPKTRAILDPDSGFRKGLKTNVANIKTPTFMVGAWFDIFGTTPTDTFNGIPLPETQKKLIMGDGYHSGTGVGGFGHPGMPPRLDVLQRAWFDKWLKGIDNGIDEYSPLTLKQQGGGWATGGTTFPRPEATYRRMYLNDTPSGTTQTSLYDGGLAAEPRQGSVRDLTVAPGLASVCSRDTARILAGILSIVVACTEDSRIWESNALTFTSAAVTEPTTISGPIAVHLNTVLDAIDGYWVATVNDVAPDGQSREIATGQLVTSLRQINEAASAKSANGDYTKPAYYLELERRQTVSPGEPVTMDIALTPVDAVLQPGHRLRVDVYASNFPKGVPPMPILADSQLKPQHLRLDPDAPSWVNIALDSDIPS
ncbi:MULTISPECIES: CocE/NonD family hydrolase [unclassified Nocardia]|uniref:CocE/NonD family hydrolase n=1 Tax=unclassified Nocardia TaxID=2637762 RepID=UPI001CE47459|nr:MULTISPECIES: CocE/NonD family hydrolase [unclassified Nocardia]